MPYGAINLPLQYAPAPWLYAHDVRCFAIPGSAENSALTGATQLTFVGVNGDSFPVWDVGWPEDIKGGKSLTEEFSWQNKSVAYRSLICSFANKYRLVAGLLGGYGSGVPSGSSGYSFSQQGLFPGPAIWGNWAATKYCRVDVTFRSLDWIPGDVGSLALEFSSDVIQVPNGSFTWASGTASPASGFGSAMGSYSGVVASDQTPNIAVKVISFVRVLKNQPTIPISQIFAAMETVNSVTFYGMPPGYVLFDTCDTFTRASGYNPTGSGYNWDVSFRFRARKIAPWNAILNGQGVWQPIVITATGQPYWGFFDYNSLFPATSNQPIS